MGRGGHRGHGGEGRGGGEGETVQHGGSRGYGYAGGVRGFTASNAGRPETLRAEWALLCGLPA
ncbi:hypothetical protein Sm713_57640 [Streptomyces sp. TS71-3]|nr:hypothetical protein Sm713_57640 [Streptomyces sp. TS71-3]